MNKIPILVLLICSYSAAVKSEADSSSVDRYGELPQIQEMTVSPNGEKIAYRIVKSGQDMVAVVSVDPIKRIAVLDVSQVKPRSVSFFNEKNLLLKVASDTSVPGFKGKFELSTAMTYNIEKKKYHQLLVPGKDKVYGGQPDLARIVGISPDGESVYMPAYSGEPTYVQGRQIMPAVSLFKSKLTGKNRARIYMQGKANTIDYFVGNNGKVLAREAFDSESNIHSVSAARGNKYVEIFTDETPYITKKVIGISTDEKQLYLLNDNNDKNRWALHTLNLADGKLAGPLYDRDDADIVGTIKDWQCKILGVRYSGFNPSYHFFDPDLNQRVQTLVAEFPQHSVWIENISPNTEHILIKVEGTQLAGDYYLASKGKETAFISSSRPNIPSDQIHPIGTVNFKAQDGLKIPTLITIPRNKIDELKNLPAIMMPHGGPSSFDSIGFNFMAQALAEQGYLVIQPQFRGSAGFGFKHQAAGYGEWGQKALSDLTDAINFFAKQGIIDLDRLCIVGASYGGYSALAGGAFTPDLYKCVVSINGIGNLSDMLDRTRNERGRSSAVLAYWEAQILGFEGEDKGIAKQRSPELHAFKFKAPVLLIHSENDENVHPRQSFTMYRALKNENKVVEKIELVDEDHYLSHNKTRLQALRATIEFVNKYLQ